MIRAFLAGCMIAVIAPTIGMFLVHRRMSFMVDALAHVSLSGIALGFLLSLNPIVTAAVMATLGAILVEQLRHGGRLTGDAALALLLYGSLGIASVLLNVAQGPGVHLESLLFGSILTVRTNDLILILLLGCIVAVCIMRFYRHFFCLVFDEEWAQTTGLNAARLNTLLILLAALTVAVSMRIIGVLLVGALMTIPVISAARIGRGFLATLVAGILLSVFSVCAGITISYYVGWPSGGTIVIVMLAESMMISASKLIYKK